MVTRRRSKAGNAALAIAYIRVSTDKQENGPDAQRAAIAAWAKREGVAIVAEYAEEDVSGADSIAARPELAKAIASLRSAGAGALVAAKRDRLARDPAIMGTVEGEAAKAGARVRTADGMSDATGSQGVIQKGMSDVLAAWEREVIRERTTAALAVKRARGERISRLAPYGSRFTADGHLETDPAEAAVIARARALRDSGLSFRAVAEELEVEGLFNRAGNALSVAAVHAMLRG